MASKILAIVKVERRRVLIKGTHLFPSAEDNQMALLQIMGFSRCLITPTGLAMVLSIVWPRILCCVLFIRN